MGIFEEKPWEKMSEEERLENEKAFNTLPESEKREAVIRGTKLECMYFLQKRDFFMAAGDLGILRYLNSSDVDFYTGMVKEGMRDYPGAAEAYKKVSSDSDEFNMAIGNLARVYSIEGEYLLLDELFSSGKTHMSTMQQLEIRMNCLEHMGPDKFFENKEAISKCRIEDAYIEKDNESDAHSFYQVCRILCDMLTVCGECINQCRHHQNNTEQAAIDYEQDPDLVRIIRVYNLGVFLLSMSEHLQALQVKEEGVMHFDEYALKDKTWQEKIRILNDPKYGRDIVSLAVSLCNPDIHRYENRYRVIHNLLDEVVHIGPGYLQSVVNRYFNDIAKAAGEKDASAIQYLGVVYSEIVARDSDPYHLKGRIHECLSDLDSDKNVTENIEWRKLALSMNQHAYEAFANAENVFTATKQKYYGIHDASALALMFFRVIEIEYNARITKPLADCADINKMKNLCGIGKKWEYRSKTEKDYSKQWEFDVNQLEDIKTGKRKSLELGTVRVLLRKILGRYDQCGLELFNDLIPLLTSSGQQAFFSQKMIDVIGRANVDAYRNPGAHTGYLPYSAAVSAEQYVRGILPTMETWFIKESR